MPKRLILASASPRRKELLACLGLPFEVIPSDAAEEIPAGMTVPWGIVERLAAAKSDEVSSQIYYEALSSEVGLRSLDSCVLGCDTIVVLESSELPVILGKPINAGDARSMLDRLSGRTHCVYTGVSITLQRWDTASNEYDLKRVTESVQTQVRFRTLTPGMIDWYIATGEPFDKAGAYGIQGHASAFVEAVYGDYFNVVGLPIQTVAKMLEEIGIKWWRGPAALE